MCFRSPLAHVLGAAKLPHRQLELSSGRAEEKMYWASAKKAAPESVKRFRKEDVAIEGKFGARESKNPSRRERSCKATCIPAGGLHEKELQTSENSQQQTIKRDLASLRNSLGSMCVGEEKVFTFSRAKLCPQHFLLPPCSLSPHPQLAAFFLSGFSSEIHVKALKSLRLVFIMCARRRRRTRQRFFICSPRQALTEYRQGEGGGGS